MIQKNVYILYPAGYHGSYVKWSIEVCDLDSRKTTPKNPINHALTSRFGGAGTAHLHERIPTHQGLDKHQNWQILNRPDHAKIYVINSVAYGRGDSKSLSNIITDLFFQDRDGVVICLHDNDDEDIRSYGAINTITKWPTYVDIVLQSTAPMIPELQGRAQELLSRGFRAIHCAQDRHFRNFLIEHEKFPSSQGILNLDVLSLHIDCAAKWYEVRNQAQPHEVNQSTYISRITNLSDRVFQINCRDIPHERYTSIFQHIMKKSCISDNWNTDPLEHIHDQYIAAQKNLQWFQSLGTWQRSGEIDDYLRSHVVIEAEIIKRILAAMGISFYSPEERQRWIMSYHTASDPSWPRAPDTEMGFHDLSPKIQRELREVYQYKFKNPIPLRPGALSLDWRNMSLDEINDYFKNS